jgi:hypothetical protein
MNVQGYRDYDQKRIRMCSRDSQTACPDLAIQDYKEIYKRLETPTNPEDRMMHYYKAFRESFPRQLEMKELSKTGKIGSQLSYL